MKILNLKIKNLENEIIRDIDFNEHGVSFIFGDIQKPENSKATINSLGKTILLKCIDYIYGANEDKKIIKEMIQGYTLVAKIKFEGKEYIVTRVLGSSDTIKVDSKSIDLSKYKEKFNINRKLYHKQFLLTKKSSLISYNSNKTLQDVNAFLKLLDLNKVITNINKIYKCQDKIKELNRNKNELISYYGNLSDEEIDEKIYFIDQDVEKQEKEILLTKKKIESLEISQIQNNVVYEYNQKCKRLKNAKQQYERNRIEIERLKDFISSSNKVDISSEHILAIYNRTNQEIPELVKRNIEEVEMFHNKVFEERKEYLNKKVEELNNSSNLINNVINDLSLDIDNLGKLISINEVYKQSVGLYEKYNNNLNNLKYQQGQLSQIKKVKENIEKQDKNLTIYFDEASEHAEDYKEKIKKYRDFISNITQNIYEYDVNSYFNIEILDKHKTRRPVNITLKLNGDTGEGVSEVGKNLVDYLLLKYNKCIDIMLQDSACYSGIDPRQVSGLVRELYNTINTTDKQAIISINKYELGNNTDVIKLVEENSALILSENDKLFGFDF